MSRVNMMHAWKQQGGMQRETRERRQATASLAWCPYVWMEGQVTKAHRKMGSVSIMEFSLRQTFYVIA